MIEYSFKNPDRWAMLFAALSLDLSRPYWSAMGLHAPPDQDAFIELIRAVIRHFRNLTASEPEKEVPFAAAEFESLKTRYGQDFAHYFYAWSTDVFQDGNDAGTRAFIWRNLILRGGLDGRRDIEKPPQFVILVRQFLSEAGEVPKVTALAPSTAWDVQLYLRNGYDNFWSPIEMVQSTISYFHFVAAWEKASKHFKLTVDIGELHTWGAKQAALLQMPAELIEDPSWPPLPKLV